VAAACAAASSASEAAAVLQLDMCAAPAELQVKAAEATALLGGQVDVLVSAAGVGQRTSVLETSEESHSQIMAANFNGAVALTRSVLPAMVERGAGHVCVVSSVQGFFGQPYRSSYAASKAAMFGYFDSLRAEVAACGVGVTVVAPGYIATDHAANAVGGDGAADDNVKKGMPPEVLAAQIADAIETGKPQLIASQLDGRVGMLLRALWPSALFKIMAKKAKKPP